MSVRSRLRTIWRRLTEPQFSPPVISADTVAKLAEPVDFKAPPRAYIPLEDAATQACAELELTVFNEFAHRDGLDETNPVINWWGNFILSTVPIAVQRKTDGDWEDVEYHDRSAGTYVTKSARLLRGNPVAVRDDHFADFLDHCRALVRDQPSFYKLSQPPRDWSVQTRMIPNSHGTITKPNRDSKFDWDSFDALSARSAVYKREIGEVVEHRAHEIASVVIERFKREAEEKVKAARKRRRRPAKRRKERIGKSAVAVKAKKKKKS